MTEWADNPSPDAIIAAARTFLGTPYRHQGSKAGIGCDCLGLIRGTWRLLYRSEPERPGPYAADWAERSGEERLYQAAFRHCGPPLAPDAARIGDIMLFRFRADAAAKHLGILSAPGRFIHAYEPVGVIESALVASWQRKVAYWFRFPPAGAGFREAGSSDSLAPGAKGQCR